MSYVIKGRGINNIGFVLSRLDFANVEYEIIQEPSPSHGSWEIHTGLLPPAVVEHLKKTKSKTLEFYPKSEQ